MQDYFQTDTAAEKYQRGCESMPQITETVPRSKYKTWLCKCSENPLKPI